MALNEEEQTDAVFKSVRTDVDPVSGNEVPPGSLPEEVRDDIPAMLSEGEYVVPADVLRYYGVKFFEDLRTMAKVGLADMEANGRIGGEPIEEQAELPFTDDELLTEEDEMEPEDEQMSAAFGGLVGFAPGGLNLPEGTQVPTSGSSGFSQDPNDPTQVLIGSAITNTGYELVTFYGPGGLDDKVNIPFFNGMAIAPIPPNYTKDLPEETELEKSTSDDPNEGIAQLAKENYEKPKVDYTNPDMVGDVIDDYYTSLAAPGLAGILTNITSSISKNSILKSIDKAIDTKGLDQDIKNQLIEKRKTLEDSSLYKEEKQEGGFANTFLGKLLGFGEQDSTYTRPDYAQALPNLSRSSAEGLEWMGNEADAYNAAVRSGNDSVVAHFQAINRLREKQNAFIDQGMSFEEGRAMGLSKYDIEQAQRFGGSLHRSIHAGTAERSGGVFSKYVPVEKPDDSGSGNGSSGAAEAARQAAVERQQSINEANEILSSGSGNQTTVSGQGAEPISATISEEEDEGPF